MTEPLLLAATDPNSIYLLRRYAEESGFVVVHANEVEDVLLLARRVKPAVIIVETGLPGMADRRVWLALKADEVTRHIPVVVYSWFEEEADDPVQGVASYLQHPLLYEGFLAALRKAGVCPPRDDLLQSPSQGPSQG